MEAQHLAVVAAVVVVYASVSRRLATTPVTGPMVFTAVGLLLGPELLDVVPLDVDDAVLHGLAELTLVLVLFGDAVRIDLTQLRRDHGLPLRLLGIGLPLTIAIGAAGAVLIFGLGWWEALLLAAVLAPTDAALGQAVVSNEQVPVRIRQALNVESGLNDGIVLPVVTLFVAGAGASESLESASFWVEFAAEQVGYGLLVGVVAGGLGAFVIDRASRRRWVSATFQQIGTLAVGVVAFGAAEAVHGNGFIAAFVGGLAFGSVARDMCGAIHEFTEEEGELLELLTFMAFGGAVLGPALEAVDWSVVGYACLSLTVIRLAPVAVAMTGAGVRFSTVGFLGWFGPRGLASILFGLLIIEESGLAVAEELFLVVTVTVAASILLHGLTAAAGSSWYGSHLGAVGMTDAERGGSHEHPTRRGGGEGPDPDPATVIERLLIWRLFPDGLPVGS